MRASGALVRCCPRPYAPPAGYPVVRRDADALRDTRDLAALDNVPDVPGGGQARPTTRRRWRSRPCRRPPQCLQSHDHDVHSERERDKGELMRLVSTSLAVFSLGVAVLSCAPQAVAQPSNDDFDNAIAITALPFSDAQDTTLATQAVDDPADPCGNSGFNSVWYSYTPSVDVPFIFDLTDTDYTNEWAIFTGPRNALHNETCGGFGTEVFGFLAKAGVTYHIRVSGGFGGGNLVFEARQGVTLTKVAIANAGAVSRASGIATVSGLAFCDQPATAIIGGTLQQRLNRFVAIHGAFDATVACSPSGSPWTASVVGENGPFAAGSAGATATGTACDVDGLVCMSQTASQVVKLKTAR